MPRNATPKIDSTEVLLLDRRRRVVENLDLIDAGMHIESVICHHSPLGSDVWVAHLGRGGGGELPPPKRVRSGSHTFRRVLDRFFLPEVPDPEVATALFDLCAPIYDELINRDRNIWNIKELLGIVEQRVLPGHDPIRVLDFGCGTGLSIEALRSWDPLKARRFELFGTDASQAMLSRSSERGLAVYDFPKWKRLPSDSFHGVMASYVLHCGIQDNELMLMARQLRPGGIFVANYHQGEKNAIDAFCKRARRMGLSEVEFVSSKPEEGNNPILVFGSIKK